MPHSARYGEGPASGRTDPVSLQLRNSTTRWRGTPLATSRRHISGEMALTLEKLRNTAASNPSASRPTQPRLGSSPVAKAVSTSRSCTCSQLCARASSAASRATGAPIVAGATVSTRLGRKAIPAQSAGSSAASAKLA